MHSIRPGRFRALHTTMRFATGLACAASCLCIATPASAAASPQYLAAPQMAPGTFTSINLASDRTPRHYFYRIPALAHLGDGVVLAAWDARPSSAADAPNPNSIIQRRSTDNGRTWGPLQIIAAGKLADAPGPAFGFSDPSFVVDRDTGRVFAFFVYSKNRGFHDSAYGNDDADRNVLSSAVIHSDDAGVSWSDPRLITGITRPANGTTRFGFYWPAAGDVRSTFATSGGGIQLRYGPHAGRLIQPYAGKVHYTVLDNPMQAYSVYSDDHGRTWQRGAFTGTGMDENKIVELSDGQVMLNARDSDNGRARKVAVSTDGGASYGPVTRDLELPDPTSNASLIRLHAMAAQGSADARKLLFINANNSASADRVNGAVRVSCDNGATWPGLRTLETGAFGYASAAVLDAGLIGVLWERNTTDAMQFSTFDEAWLNYVCAPLTVPARELHPGVATEIPVTVTNQEATALSGAVSFFTPAGWSASSASIGDLAPGAATTVAMSVTPPAGASGTHPLQAVFSAADGRVSQVTVALRLR